jgi:NADH-quinone oxidoreductase subunit L
MLFDFRETPGYYFVAATLVPLASFVLILLWSALWAVARPYRDTDYGALIYNFFGGDKPGRGKAYVALTAIVIAFLLSATGFVYFTVQHTPFYLAKHRLEDLEKEVQHLKHQQESLPKSEDEEKREELAKQFEEKEQAVKDLQKQIADDQAAIKKAWFAHWDWLRISPTGIADRNNGTVLRLGFGIDSLNALMFVMVTFIASLIHIFSLGYMSDELAEEVEDHHVHTEHGHFKRRGRFGRFFMYLSLFCFSMLNLILADNLFQVFVSWELVGICSYLLIGFYYERQSASNAANKAFIANRVGDAGFIIGLLIIWTYCGTFNFEEIFHKIRKPEQAAQLYGQPHHIIRGEVTTDPTTSKKTFELSDAGSQVLLFPLATERMAGNAVTGAVGAAAKTLPPEIQANPKDTEYSSMPYWVLVAAGLGIFLGCVGKSAQFPLQVWLPDAMEGPTPVSALIHAATMVAAGVYFVGRCYSLFTPEALLVIAYTGGITLFVAATIAVVMTDIKKVLAYSTVSQLGYMILALGIGGWMAGLFHLMTHAFFKALLFLCSGSVIYGCHHEQDMSKMGGLFPKMKITALTMLMGTLAIAGTPLFTGWYSKDAILANAFGYAWLNPTHSLLFVLPFATAGLTAFYMFRMWCLTFLGKPRDEHVYEHAHESPWLMTIPLIVLAVLSVCVAWGWPIWDAEESAMMHLLENSQPASVQAMFPEELAAAQRNHWRVGLVTLGVVCIGVVFAGVVYVWKLLDANEAEEQFPRVHAFLMNKWYFDDLYSVVLVRPVLVVAHWLKAFDLGVIDGILHSIAAATLWLTRVGGRIDSGIVDGLVNVVGDSIFAIGAWLRGVQTGYLRSYVLFMALAAVVIFVALSYFVAVSMAAW